MIFNSEQEMKRVFNHATKWILLSGFGFLIAACGYQGVEVFFFEEYANLMDDENYRGDSGRNTAQIEAFEDLIENLRKQDPEYEWTADLVTEDEEDANSVADRNDNIHNRDQDQIDFHAALARYHAPVIYQDMDNAWRSADKLSNPSAAELFGLKVGARDFPTPLILTTAANVKNNAAHMDELLKDPADLAAVIPTLYYEVKETLSHYFITYVLYYPHNRFKNAKYKVDGAFPSPQSFDHDQDIEFAVYFIRKNSNRSGAGILDFVLTARHGIGHLHHPDLKTQNKLRRAFGDYLTEGERRDAALGPIYQPHALRHDTAGAPHFLQDGEGNNMGIYLYAPRFGHALNQASPDVWRKGYGTGLILLPESQSFEANNFDFTSRWAENGIRPYQLLSWTEVKNTYRTNENVFVGSNQFSASLSDGKIRQRQESPDAIVKGPEDAKAKSVLAEASYADTPHPMALPHAVLEFFDDLLGDDSSIEGEISDYYVFNPEIEYSSLD